jgi:hypothetical protein
MKHSQNILLENPKGKGIWKTSEDNIKTGFDEQSVKRYTNESLT